jgi:6-phosphogluconolactonase (cycloisomerase 2 family)
LTAVAGSPFSIGNPFIVRGAAKTLLVGSELTAYSVDAATGAITKGTTAGAIPVDLAVSASGAVAYNINNDPCQAMSCRSMTAYRVANGTLQFISGAKPDEGGTGPYSGAPLNEQREALDPNGHWLYVAAIPGPGPTPGTELRAFALNADGSFGSVTPRSHDLCSDLVAMAAAAKGSRSFVYDACASSAHVEFTVVDNSNGSVVSFGQQSTAGSPMAVAVDPSGRYLLVAEVGSNIVEVFAVNSDGSLTSTQQIGAGASPNAITFDSTGQFVYVTNGGCYGSQTCAPGSNDISAYRFNNGSLQPIGTYPAGQSPLSIAVVKP